jgi:hypothetical protein
MVGLVVLAIEDAEKQSVPASFNIILLINSHGDERSLFRFHPAVTFLTC